MVPTLLESRCGNMGDRHPEKITSISSALGAAGEYTCIKSDRVALKRF